MGKQLGRKNNKRKLKWILEGIVIALLLAGGGIYAGFMVTDIIPAISIIRSSR